MLRISKFDADENRLKDLTDDESENNVSSYLKLIVYLPTMLVLYKRSYASDRGNKVMLR